MRHFIRINKVLYRIIAAGLLLALVSCGKTDKTRVIKLASTLPMSHPVSKALVFLANRVKKESGGKLKIEIYPSGQLGSEREALELLQIGSIGMTKVSAAALESFDPAFKAVDMPYIFTSNEQRFRVLDSQLGKQLLLGAQKFWLRGLCYYDAGSRSFYTVNKPVRTPADLKGLKIRVQNSDIAVEMIRDLGAAATPIPFGELYSALQQGVVDGAENNPPSLYFSRQYEVVKYYTLDEHTAIPDVLLISTILWNRLTPQEHQWIQEAADSSAAYQREIWARLSQESLDKMKQAGVTVIRPDKSAFVKKVQPLYDQFKEEDPKLDSMINRIRDMERNNPANSEEINK